MITLSKQSHRETHMHEMPEVQEDKFKLIRPILFKYHAFVLVKCQPKRASFKACMAL